ncbi:hypothetical protein C8R43DRAFT_944962 [Mycena crocata]|nr:hypothetical protein C8R43DRAFT_944962 [Mycena crocata]
MSQSQSSSTVCQHKRLDPGRHRKTRVKLVAELTRYQVTATKRKFTLDDSTGIIEGHMWMSTSADKLNAQWRGLNPGATGVYVEVVGRLCVTKGIKHLLVDGIRLVADPHQIYFHLLDCMRVSLELSKHKAPLTNVYESDSDPASSENTASSAAAYPIPVTSSNLAERIIAFMESKPLLEGVPVQDLVSGLAENPAELSLLEEGILFTAGDSTRLFIV